MAAEPRLTISAYLVLGMVEQLGAATPYDLKSFASISINTFWKLPHTQIYAQCDRLAAAGLLAEEREDEGRRRRRFSITPDGKTALRAWLDAPTPEPVEIRSLATLKLFFGADPRALASEQLAQHRRQLAAYQQIERDYELLPGHKLALEMGIGHEREFIAYWERLAVGGAADHPRGQARDAAGADPGE